MPATVPEPSAADAELRLRARTALHRKSLSRPLRQACNDDLIEPSTTVLDYGCGRGGDLARLRRAGVACMGWDPAHRRRGSPGPADVVNLGFVVNVIEDPAERARTLRSAWSFAKRVLIVSARLRSDAGDLAGVPFRDGIRTSTGTFQKLFAQDELRTWVESTLGERVAVAGPGIVYVFRDPVTAQEWTLRRLRRVRRRAPVSRSLLARHDGLLAPLIAFIEERGRLPRDGELEQSTELKRVFGSPRAAFATVRRVTGTEPWDEIRELRSRDLLVFLALARFGGRPRPKDLPDAVRLDVRDLFGSHRAACEQADRLLLAIADHDRMRAAADASSVGWASSTAMCVHADAIAELPPVLRVLDGVARQLVGELPSATVVKLSLGTPTVTYFEYPDFDRVPHPTLASAYEVSLDRLDCVYRDYSGHDDPPILHRKEILLSTSDPRRARFARLTRQEQRAGLYRDPAGIGRRSEWQRRVESVGAYYRGHRLVRRGPNQSTPTRHDRSRSGTRTRRVPETTAIPVNRQ